MQRLLLLAGRGASEAQAGERVLQDSGAGWTIVRASGFNQNLSEGEFARMVRDGAIVLPAGAIPEPFVDADDIAGFAVAALTETGHAGELCEVTGPHLLIFDDVARELAQATGRVVALTPIPRAAFAEAVAASGAPRHMAWLQDYLFGTVLDGRNAHTCDGVERALGRPRTDFAALAGGAGAGGVSLMYGLALIRGASARSPRVGGRPGDGGPGGWLGACEASTRDLTSPGHATRISRAVMPGPAVSHGFPRASVMR